MSEELPDPPYHEPPADDWYAQAPEPAGRRRADPPQRRSGGERSLGLNLSAATTRWLLAAVAAGAVAVAGVTVLFTHSSSDTLHAQLPGSGSVTGAVAGGAFDKAQPGDCLTWTKPDATDLSKIDCAQPHLFEVAGNVDLSRYPGAEFAPGASFPSDFRFKALNTTNCQPAVVQYLGGKFDPSGRFRVGMINPGAAGWNAGDRTLRCGLQQSGPDGIRRPIVGTVASQDQSDIHDPGTCIGIDQHLPTDDPVDCATAHAWEVVSTVDLSSQFTAPPSKDNQDKITFAACPKAAADYLGSPDALRTKALTVSTSVVIKPDSWLAGSHRVNCVVDQFDNDGFATIVGSAKGNITIDGQVPVPPPVLPSGRWMPPPLPGAAAPSGPN